jgi:hypothetical protein
MHFIGAAEPDWTSLAQYGVLGIILLLVIFGKLVPGYIYDRKVEEHEADKAEMRRLEETLKERVIPALTKSTDVLAEMSHYLDDRRAERRVRGEDR